MEAVGVRDGSGLGRGSVGEVVLGWAGLDVGLLEQLPVDRAHYTRQLALIGGVAGLACVSVTTALAMTSSASPWGWPVVFGLAAGLFVATLDVSVTVDVSEERGRAAVVGRLAVAVVAGVLLSMPLTAALFQRDVDHAQEVARAEKIRAAQTTGLAAAQDVVRVEHGPAVEAVRATRDRLQASLGEVQGQAVEQRRACTGEIDGVAGSGIPGEGPRATAKCSAAVQLEAQAGELGRQVAVSEGAWQRAVEAQQVAVAGAVAPVPAPYTPSELGVVDRIKATHELLGWPASLAVTLVLVLVDLVPVTMHLTRGRSAYADLVCHRQQAAARRAATESVVARQGGLEASEPVPEPEGVGERAPVDDSALEAWVRARWAAEPSLSRAALYDELARAGYEAGYSSFTRWLRKEKLSPRSVTSGLIYATEG